MNPAFLSTTLARQLSNHIWQSTLFAFVAALLALALRRYPARARYWLWLSASAKFLVPFSLLIAIGAHIPRPTRTTPTQTTVPLAAYQAIAELSQPFTDSPNLTTAIPTTPTPAHSRLLTLPTLLAALWLIGFLTILTRWLIQLHRIAKSIRNATPLLTGRVPETLRRIEHLAHITRPIPILSSPKSTEPVSMEPGVFGILRPILLWPEAISPHLDDAHLEAILAHEAAHVRRRDNLTSLLPMLVEAIFWFHPLVWWMESQLIKERERACDEEVLLLCHHPQAYAESILKVCELCIESPLTCVSGITGADLKRRIVQIMTAPIARKLGLGAKLLLLSAASLAIAMPILLGHATAAQRMMLAAVNAAPSPIRTAAHAMIALEQTPSTGLIAEVQPPTGADATLPDVTPAPSFEVATIKPDDLSRHPGATSWSQTSYSQDELKIAGSLKTLLKYAYGIEDNQISGGPKWFDSGLFDIVAKASSPTSLSQMKLMLRTLLDQRFKLATHTVTKPLPVYSLVVAKSGPKLQQADLSGPLGNGSDPTHVRGALDTAQLAQFLTRVLGRTVIDNTGLNGIYKVDLTWAADDQPSGPSLFTAIQEQLGLKLEPTKGPVATLVIDHAEQPSMDGAELSSPNPQSPPENPSTNIAAAWQGTLHTDRDVRFVFKITKASDGTLRATFYNIDAQPPDAIPAISTTLNGSSLKLELPFATYAGTVSADGSSIAGTWRQGQNPLPLNLARATPETEWTIPQPPRIAPMAADANPAFEVATIKPSRPDENGPRYDFQGRRFSVIHVSLNQLVQFAYELQQSQIAKAQDWVNSESYDISAVPDGEGEPSGKQWQSMVEKLMADRFQLKFHFAKQEQTVYLLTVVKTGPKLTKSESDPGAPGGNGFGPGGFGATNETMADVARALGAGVLNRPVVDRTGLSGRFNLRLRWTPDGPATATEAGDPNAPPDFFTSIQEQLGLKLVSTKAPIDVLVIDHIERPSEN